MIIPNALAQNRAMSCTVRGLLVDLLSRPDDWRETCRQMADSSPQGRKALAAALDELRAWGYYRVEVVRLADGRLRSEVHVFDRPQPGGLPGTTPPGSGESDTAECGVLPKDLVKVPSLPTAVEPVAEGGDAGDAGGWEEDAPAPVPRLAEPVEEPDEATLAAMNALLRAVRPDRRLPLGAAEAVALAPLVREWMERGGSEDQLRAALLSGLPEVVYSPAGVLRSRLERKMPVERPAAPTGRRRAECAECRDPLPQPGLCGRCSGAARRHTGGEQGAEVTARGMTKVRAALAGSAV
ncbi:hypothetical protein OG455_10625 [Kitasatospora sp. NBC_01287]|uniref:hypothetical protein n=1 Tax=Kitasatospora sp. NBC_01287 TaxID=2903573 RepID=UPI00225C0D0C|nr:hypothetical protein [Kitasatospora sp. NBC_01287]MCX4745974.1 hypothetical protein [Kitasatospora sp. NBC_01287]